MSFVGRSISITIDETELVSDVSVTCEPSELVALVGPNGAGKSLMLAALAGRRRSSGTVGIDNRALREWGNRELARSRSVLQQRTHLPFEFPVRKVIELGRYPWRGLDASGEHLPISRYLEAVGMGEFAGRTFPTLSGGEKRRVQLARVLAQVRALEHLEMPRWVLLDEPLASLDIGESARIQRLIRRLSDNRVGVLAVFHDLNAAARLADHILLMREGEILSAGSPATTITRQSLEACFGTPVAIDRDGEDIRHIRAQLDEEPGPGRRDSTRN